MLATTSDIGRNFLNSLLCTKYTTVASPNICSKLFPTLDETTLHTEPEKMKTILYLNVDKMHLRNISFPTQFIYGILCLDSRI